MTTLSRRSVLGAAMAGAGLSTLPLAAFGDPLDPGEHRALRADTASGPLYQTSFEANEQDPDWLTTSTSYVSDVARTGTQSLKYARTNATDYQLASISLPAVPDTQYELTCYVRVGALAGSTTAGARIALEGYDATTGKWISGGYGANVRSTDWVQSRVLYTAPPGAGSISAVVYLYKGITGTAWFDDLVVKVVQPEVFTSELQTPTYRGLLVPGDHDGIDLIARVGLEPAELATHQVRFSTVDGSGVVVDTATVAAAAELDYTCAASQLAVGKHTVRAELLDANDAIVATEEWGVEKVAAVPANFIDRHRRLIRNGEPFFPLGMYHSRIDQAAIDDLAGTPFNTLLAYSPPNSAALDLAGANDINVIYSLKDFFYDSTQGAKPAEIVTAADEVPVITARVNALKNHPALLAWYMVDEPTLEKHPRMIEHFDAVAANDPAHPAFSVHYLAPEPAEDWLRACDVFGIDNYPVHGVPGEPINSPAQRTAASVRRLPQRAMWHVPQSFGWSAFNRPEWSGRFPTVEEFRNMTWQFLCAGATGLIYYELYYMHADKDLTFAQAMEIASTVAGEVADVVPVLLTTEPPPEATVPEAEWLDVLVKSHQGTAHLFAVNLLREVHQGDFVVPAAVSVDVVGENRTLPVASDGSFSDDFVDLAIHHYAVELVDFTSLARLTSEAVDRADVTGKRGVETAATGMVQRAAAASAKGDTSAAGTLLDSYRSFVTSQQDKAFSADDAAALVRLSRHVLD